MTNINLFVTLMFLSQRSSLEMIVTIKSKSLVTQPRFPLGLQVLIILNMAGEAV